MADDVVVKLEMTLVIRLTPQQANYLDACARVRDISHPGLVSMLIERICQDKLCTAVMDDDGQPPPHQARRRYKHRYNHCGYPL